MSLINDALKRAKEAQQQAPPSPSSQMHFRPVEPAQHARHGLGLMLPAALAVVALLALFLVWQRAQERQLTGPQAARALTAPAAQATIAPQPASPLVTATAPVTAVANPPAATAPATPASPPVTEDQQSEVSISAAILPPPAPKPAPLRLQAIVFNPKRPSALISGKTLFIGDKLGDSRVVAIDQESATLVGAGKTNVLSLPE
jgi:hypothetical protein